MVLPLLVAAAGLQAAGTLKAGMDANAAGKYNAKKAKRAAAVSRDQAAAAMIRQDKEARKAMGAMRAAYGAAGVTVEGSPLEVLAESAANAELDRLTIKYRGELAAQGYESDAALSKFEGKSALTGSLFKAAGTILGGFQ